MGWMDDLDGSGVCAPTEQNHLGMLRHEATQIYLAAHWADIYNGDARDATGAVLPGMERAKRLGAAGTPAVLEFGHTEFAALHGMHPLSGQNLMRDGLNLRHRHPLLWARIRSAQARVWQARKVAQACAHLDHEQARWVDAATAGYSDTLSWGRFEALVAAKVIEVDPAAEEARRRAAAAERFVRTGQCNEHGLKTLVAKAEAGDVIWFVAMADRIALILAAGGDTDSADVRRSKAIGILANPAQALQLLTDFEDQLAANRATARPPGSDDADRPDDGGNGDNGDNADRPDDGGNGDNGDEGDRPDDQQPEDEGDRPGDQQPEDDDPEVVGEGDVHPSENDADDPAPETHPCPTCSGEGAVTGDPAAFTKPVRVDPKKLLPPATLYIHLSQDSFTRDPNTGVARFEGYGPISVAQAREFLGTHCAVTIKPVIDIAGQVPVDAYEVPAAMGEALHLRNLADVFPFGTNMSRKKDKDHSVPYLSPDKGGPPGQTNMGNLGPLIRFHHRIRTHSRWRLKQPEPGLYLWRSPHGWIYLVDHAGTHNLGNTATAHALWDNAGRKNEPAVELTPADDIIEYEPAHENQIA